MALNRDNFATSDLGMGSNAPKCNSYRTTTDNKAAIIAAGYFNGVENQLQAGDFILSSASDGDILIAVAANTAGVITVTSVALA